MTDARNRLVTSITALNPGIDLTGPVEDLFVNPIATEVDDLDARLESTKSLLSGEYDPNRSSEEIEKAAATRGRLRDPGKAASGTVYLRSPVPPVGLRINTGAIVATTDRIYQYIVMEDVIPTSAEVEASFNSAIGQYEFPLRVQAIQIGAKYNIAATKIRYISVALPAGAYVINTEAIEGGQDQQSLESLWNDYQSAGTLADTSSQSGLAESLFKAFSGSGASAIYVSNDMSPPSPIAAQSKPTVNIYVIGANMVQVQETHAVSKDGTVTLNNRYVDQIVSISRGSSSIISFTNNDNIVAITEAYTEGETVIVTYIYNSLLQEMQNQVSAKSADLFNYNLVIKAGVPEDLLVDVNARIQQGLIGSNAESLIKQALMDYYNGLLYTNQDINQIDLTGYLKNQFAGIIKVTMNRLVILSVEQQLTGFPLYIAPPKYPRLLESNAKVNILTS